MRGLGWKVIVLLVLGSFVFLWLVKAPIMASYLTSRLKVPISLSNVSMWPTETILKNFRINNPHGFSMANAFKVKRTEIHYQLKNLFSDPCIIDTVSMDTVYIGIELKNADGTMNNWTAIGENISREENPREVIIHKMILTNITVEIRGQAARLMGVPETQTIARIEFDEIDSREGFPTKELIKQIFKQAGLQQYIQELLNPENIFQKATSPLRLFGSQKE